MSKKCLFSIIVTILVFNCLPSVEGADTPAFRDTPAPYADMQQFGNQNVSASGRGKQYWVDVAAEDADDAGPGTQELPWKTFQHASDSAQAGDTVNVMPGIYQDDTVNETKSMWRAFAPRHSGERGNPITFRSVVPRQAVLKSSAPDTDKAYRNKALSFWGKHDIIYDGFKTIGMVHINGSERVNFINGEVTVGSMAWDDPSLFWGIAVERADNCVIRNNKIHKMTIVIKDGKKYTRNNQGGIMIFGGNKMITNNLIEHNYLDMGFNVYAGMANKGGNVRHNLWQYNFIKNAEAGLYTIGSTDGTRNVNDSYYRHNIMVDTKVGMYFNYDTLNTYLINNTFVRNAHAMRFVCLNSFDTIFVNNAVYDCKSYIDAWGYYGSKGKNYMDMFELADYNQFDHVQKWVIKDSFNNQRASSLADLVDSGLDTQSTKLSLSFINPVGTEPEDFKRTSYEKDGIGGAYSQVIGAYVDDVSIVGTDWK